MRILFAEDDESQQLAFGDVVHDWNEQNEERLIEVIKARDGDGQRPRSSLSSNTSMRRCLIYDCPA